MLRACCECFDCASAGADVVPDATVRVRALTDRNLRAVFDSQEWMSVHMDMKINQVVVIYLDIEEILRPVSAPVVSVCK